MKRRNIIKGLGLIPVGAYISYNISDPVMAFDYNLSDEGFIPEDVTSPNLQLNFRDLIIKTKNLDVSSGIYLSLYAGVGESELEPVDKKVIKDLDTEKETFNLSKKINNFKLNDSPSIDNINWDDKKEGDTVLLKTQFEIEVGEVNKKSSIEDIEFTITEPESYNESWSSGNLDDYTFDTTIDQGYADAEIDSDNHTSENASLFMESNHTGSGSDNTMGILSSDFPIELNGEESFRIKLNWKQEQISSSFNNQTYVRLRDGSTSIRIRHRGPDSGSPSSQGFDVSGGILDSSADEGSAYSGGEWDWVSIELEVDYSNNEYRLYRNGSTVHSGSVTDVWENPSNMSIDFYCRVEGGGHLKVWFDDIVIENI